MFILGVLNKFLPVLDLCVIHDASPFDCVVTDAVSRLGKVIDGRGGIWGERVLWRVMDRSRERIFVVRQESCKEVSHRCEVYLKIKYSSVCRVSSAGCQSGALNNVLEIVVVYGILLQWH